MEDVFDLIEREYQSAPLKQKMIEALEQNHWTENVIVKDERDQRILHESLVEGRSPDEIATRLRLSRVRVIDLKNRGLLWLERFVLRERKGAEEEKTFAVLDFDFDVLEAVQQPESTTVQDTEQLLSMPIEEYAISVRLYNALKAHKLHYLRDIVLTPPEEMLKYRNFGKKSLLEIESFIFGLGLKWKDHILLKPGLPPITKIYLPAVYPVANFTWSSPIPEVFQENGILTINDLYLSRSILLNCKKISFAQLEFIKKRLNEWGLKWK